MKKWNDAGMKNGIKTLKSGTKMIIKHTKSTDDYCIFFNSVGLKIKPFHLYMIKVNITYPAKLLILKSCNNWNFYHHDFEL